MEWDITVDGSTATTPGQVELVEVDVAASVGTASAIPISYVTTAISSSSTTSVVINAALQGTATQFQVGTLALGGAVGSGEQMLVTAGGNTTLTVVRGINGTTALASIPVGTYIYALPGSDIISDVQPMSALPFADPTYATVANSGAAITGFGFTTLNRLRVCARVTCSCSPNPALFKAVPLGAWFEINPGRYGQIRCTYGADGTPLSGPLSMRAVVGCTFRPRP